MNTQVNMKQREVVLVEDAHVRPMMGLDVLESLPARGIPYALVDPYILVHEGVMPITPEWASQDTEHPHRGFDNLWYVIAGFIQRRSPIVPATGFHPPSHSKYSREISKPRFTGVGFSPPSIASSDAV